MEESAPAAELEESSARYRPLPPSVRVGKLLLPVTSQALRSSQIGKCEQRTIQQSRKMGRMVLASETEYRQKIGCAKWNIYLYSSTALSVHRISA
jgi:hypothetical protein